MCRLNISDEDTTNSNLGWHLKLQKDQEVEAFEVKKALRSVKSALWLVSD